MGVSSTAPPASSGGGGGGGGAYRVKAGVLGYESHPHPSVGFVTITAQGWGWSPWVEAAPASAILTDRLLVGASPGVSGWVNFVYEIGIGAAGAESRVAQFRNNENSSVQAGVFSALTIPVRIPANTRVAIRGTCNGSAVTSYVAVLLVPVAALEGY